MDRTLQRSGVPPLPSSTEHREGVLGWLHSVARSHVDVALEHPIRLIANALGSPPVDVIERVHKHDVLVGALAGRKQHAERHVANGVDVVIAQGHEAGGHTGEIASMVLWPEIAEAVGSKAYVLGAGGVGSGRQIAAALALGCDGVWMGSLWLMNRPGMSGGSVTWNLEDWSHGTDYGSAAELPTGAEGAGGAPGVRDAQASVG